MLSIKGMNKAQILAELYNAAKSNGATLKVTKDMTIEEAEDLLKKLNILKI